MITQQRLHELATYNPETGAFVRRSTGKKMPGWKDKDGYLVAQLDNREYRMHRLAWLSVTGDWPTRFIDHKNMVRHDNSFTNLREADHSTNACNQPHKRTNKCGYKGVDWVESAKGWRAQIMKSGRKYQLGHYPTPQEAHAAYVAAAQRLHGEFYRAR